MRDECLKLDGVGFVAALVYGSFFEWLFHVMHRFGKRFWLPGKPKISGGSRLLGVLPKSAFLKII